MAEDPFAGISNTPGRNQGPGLTLSIPEEEPEGLLDSPVVSFGIDLFKDVSLNPIFAIGDIPKDVVDLGQDFAKFFDVMDQDFDFDVPAPPEAKTGVGKIQRTVLGYIIPFTAAMKAFKGIKFLRGLSTAKVAGGTLVASSFAGGIADFVALDPEEPNMSNWIQEYPSLRNPVTEYLAYDPDSNDSNLEQRLKNSIEGLGLGLGIEGGLRLFQFTLKGLKFVKEGLWAKNVDNPEAYMHDVQEILGEVPVHGVATKSLDNAGWHELPVKVSVDSLKKGLDVIDSLDSEFRTLGPKVLREQMTQLVEKFGIDEARTIVFNSDKWDFKDLIEIVNIFDDLDIVRDQSSLLTGSLSLKESDKIAKEIAKELNPDNPERIIASMKRTHGESAFLGEKLLAYKDFLNDSARRIGVLVRKTLTGSISDTDRFNFLHLLDTHIQAQPLVEGISANTSRALGVQRITIKGTSRRFKDIKPADIKNASKIDLTNMDTALNQYPGGRGAIDKMMRKMHNVETANGMRKALREQGRWEQLARVHLENRFTNMLSSPATFARNILGSLYRITMANFIEEAVASGIGVVQGTRTGEVAIKETFIRAHAIVSSSFDYLAGITTAVTKGGPQGRINTMGQFLDDFAIDQLTRAQREGVNQGAISREFILEDMFGVDPANQPVIHMMGKALDWWGAIKRIPSFGAIRLGDVYFKTAAFNAEVAVDAFRKSLGVTEAGKLSTKVSPISAAAREEIVVNFTDRVTRFAKEGESALDGLDNDQILDVLGSHDRALREARDTVFQGELPGVLENIAQGLNASNVPAHFLKAYFLPFFRTSMQILGFVSSRTPGVNLLAKKAQANLFGSNKQARAKELAKMFDGTMVLLSGAGLASSGILTGRHPEKFRRDRIEAGVPEYAINIPGAGWLQYNRQDPLGTFLGLSADFWETGRFMAKDDFDQAWSTFHIGVAENTLNKTYMRSIGDVVAAWRTQNWERVVPNLLGPDIPSPIPTNFTRSIERLADPNMRETRDFVDAMMLNIPGGRHTLPERLNVLWQPKLEAHGLVDNMAEMLGSRPITPSKDPAILELGRLAAFVGLTGEPHVMGITLEGQDAIEFRKIMGEIGSVEILNKIVLSPGYARLPEPAKEDILKRAQMQLRNIAGAKIFNKFPEIREKVLAKQLFDIQKYFTDVEKPVTDPNFDELNRLLDFDASALKFKPEE